MTIEEIVRGESKSVEFKAKLPEDSAKYVKTIIAFANTQGGCLVIGVDDVTRRVIGVDDDSAFQIMDRIANVVADSCAPQIVPNIELQTIDGHTVVLVTVTPEPNRPYYLKAKGKELGTYIRLAGTSRPASPEKIKELEMEGAHISWDELTCIGYEVTDKEIKKLCGYYAISGKSGTSKTKCDKCAAYQLEAFEKCRNIISGIKCLCFVGIELFSVF